jgi:hypothetical protein
MTTRPEPAPTPPRTRRALLAGALGGLAAWAAGAAARADPTAAAAGDPIRMGGFNKAGGTSTTLQTGSDGAALRVVQLQGSSAVRAGATSGRAVQALAGSSGTAVWAFSPDHIGVRGTSDTGLGIYGSSASSYAAWFEGEVRMSRSVEMGVSSMPDAPSSGARLFARATLAGKTELCVRFPTGGVIVLATQP